MFLQQFIERKYKKEFLFKLLNLLDNHKDKVILSLHPRTKKIIHKYKWKAKKI